MVSTEQEVVNFLKGNLDPSSGCPEVLREFCSVSIDLYTKKLWHNLSLELEKLCEHPRAQPYLITLYEKLVKSWEGMMNPLTLVKFLTKVSAQFETPQNSLEFLTEQAKKFADDPELVEAYVSTVIQGALYKIIIGDMDGCKQDINTCEKLLENRELSDMYVSASFYSVSARYYKETQNYSQHYQTALIYLSSVNMDELTIQHKQEIAYDLCMSALLGEDIYNFGELLMHPVLACLESSPQEWIGKLIYCFNNGDNVSFDAISRTSSFLKQSKMVNSLPFLRQKLCLMTLVESIFYCTKENLGCISFYEISEKTGVQFNEVEHLIMRAISLGLINGKINQVKHHVSVSRVQPRILDMSQISHLLDRIQDWSEEVKKYMMILDSNGDAVDTNC